MPTRKPVFTSAKGRSTPFLHASLDPGDATFLYPRPEMQTTLLQTHHGAALPIEGRSFDRTAVPASSLSPARRLPSSTMGSRRIRSPAASSLFSPQTCALNAISCVLQKFIGCHSSKRAVQTPIQTSGVLLQDKTSRLANRCAARQSNSTILHCSFSGHSDRHCAVRFTAGVWRDVGVQ
jgi:hypothetical protein